MSAAGALEWIGYLTVSRVCEAGRPVLRYEWRGGPQILVDLELFTKMEPGFWTGHVPPHLRERARLGPFAVRVVGYDAGCDWYVLMREDGDEPA